MISELAEEALDNPTKRILKVLEKAEAEGWTTGVVSVCVRLSKSPETPVRAAKAKPKCPCCGTAELISGRTVCPSCRVLGRTAPEEEAEPEALPFYATWILKGWTPTGKPSWSFTGSRASNGQALSEADVLLYLESPEIITPDYMEENE